MFPLKGNWFLNVAVGTRWNGTRLVDFLFLLGGACRGQRGSSACLSMLQTPAWIKDQMEIR